MAEHSAGTVTHYFVKPQVGIVLLTTEIRVGDTLRCTAPGSLDTHLRYAA